MSRTAIYRETLMLWPAWEILAAQFGTKHPAVADPHEIFECACAAGHDRLVALIYGHGIGETALESEDVVDEVLAMARDGRRPRDGSALGLVMRSPRPVRHRPRMTLLLARVYARATAAHTDDRRPGISGPEAP